MMNARMKICARALLLSSAIAMPMTITAPAAAADQASVNLNIPAQDLGKALSEFARQSNQQLLYSPELVRGKTSTAVSGAQSPEKGLRALLVGTGVSASLTKSGAFTLSAGPNAVAGGDQSSDSAGSESLVEDQAGISEILVVGSRSQNVDIKRSADDPQPYVVFDSKQIERSGTANLEEFLRTRLTMTSSQAAPSNIQTQPVSANAVNINTFSSRGAIALRGFSVEQTLILIDGRRAPRGSVTGGLNQYDINGIALSSIDRVEVLPATAGGIYGGGAIGGVINIILKRNYRGVDFTAERTGTFRGGGESIRLSATGGFTLFDGQTQINFAGSWSKANSLKVSDNDLWKRARARFLETPLAAFSLDGDKRALINGATPRICAGLPVFCFDFQDLVLGANNLGASVVVVPTGYPGVSSDAGAGLIANVGKYNLDLSPQDAQSSLRNAPEIYSANLGIRQEISNRVQLFTDFAFSENRGSYDISPFSGILLFPGVPGNPFNNLVGVFLPLYGVDNPKVKSASQSLNANGGIIAKIGGGWSALAEFGWSSESAKGEGLQNPIDTNALAADAAAGNIDIFRDLEKYPIDFTPYLRTFPDITYAGKTVQTTASLRVSGPLMNIWGGAIVLTGSAESRKETAKPYTTSIDNLTGADTSIYNPARSQTVQSAYAELNIPIVSARNSWPLFHSLEMQGAIRYDNYVTRSPFPTEISNYDPSQPLPAIDYRANEVDAFSYTLAAKWEPVRTFAVRASYATGFLAPSINQIVSFAPINVNLSSVLDPLRNEPLGIVSQTTGGNVNLRPETSKSFSAGVIFTPSFIDGLRISLDYLKIRKRDEISGSMPRDYLLVHEADFPGRVTRAPSSGGLPGKIIAIDTTAINNASKTVAAIDARFDYETSIPNFGDISIFGAATRQREFIAQIQTSDVAVNSVGFYDGPLKWRANFGASVTRGPLTLTWSAQYFDSYSVEFADLSIVSQNPSRIIAQGSDKISSQFYNDLLLQYRLPEKFGSWAKGTELSLGVQNIFDKRPPVDIASTWLGNPPLSGYSFYGDPRLRRYSLGLRKSF